LFVTPLLMAPWGQSLCGRIKDVALWLMAGVLGWLLAALWREKPEAMRVSPRLVRSALPWLVVVVLSTAFAVATVVSAWAAFNMLPPLLLAVAIAILARRTAARRRILETWVASAAVVSVYAIVQHYGLTIIPWPSDEPFLRASGTIGAPIYLAAFQALTLPFAVGLTRLRRAPRWLGPAIAIITAALVITYSRGPWAAAAAGILVTLSLGAAAPHDVATRRIGLAIPAMLTFTVVAYVFHWYALPLAAVTGLCMALWAWRLADFRRAVAALTAGLAFGVLFTAIDAVRPDTQAMDRITETGDSGNKSLYLRGLAWQAATQMVWERPLRGWGQDGFRLGATSVARDNLSFSDPLLYPHQNAHNDWYTAAVDSGLPGVVAWTLLLLGIANAGSDRVRAAKRRITASQSASSDIIYPAAAFGALAAFVVQGMVTPKSTTTWMGLALCWGIASALEPVEWRRRRSCPRVVRPVTAVWSAGCLFLAVAVFASDMLAGVAGKAIKNDNLAAALPPLQAAARWNPMDPDYARGWGEIALDVADRSDGRVRQLAATQAVTAYMANLALEPGNGTWHAGTARALAYLDTRAAGEAGFRAVTLAPMSSNAWWSLAAVMRAEGDTVREKQCLAQAITVDAIAPEPYIRLAEIFRTEGRPDLSDRLLTEAADTWKNREDLAPWRGRTQAKAQP
jgi:O-antigen ligase